MSKFCGNCGAKMDDDDKVCGECGTPFSDSGSSTTATSVVAGKKGGMNSIIKIGAAALIGIIALVLAINIIGSSSGYKGTLNKMIKSYKNADPEIYMSVISYVAEEMAEEIYDEDAEDKLYDSLDGLITERLDEYEDSVGNIKKISYEITDENDISDRKVDKFKDEIEENYNIDASDIKAIKAVKIKISVKGAKKTAVFHEDVCLIKEPGGWKIIPGYDGSDF